MMIVMTSQLPLPVAMILDAVLLGLVGTIVKYRTCELFTFMAKWRFHGMAAMKLDATGPR